MPKPLSLKLHNAKIDNMFLFASTLKTFHEEISNLINSIEKTRKKIISSDKIITDTDMKDLNTIKDNISANIADLLIKNSNDLKKLHQEIQENLQSLIEKVEAIENNLKKSHNPKTEVFAGLLRKIRTLPVIKHLVHFLRNKLEPRLTKTEQWKAITNDGNVISHSKDIKSKAQELRKTKLKDFEKINAKKEEPHSDAPMRPEEFVARIKADNNNIKAKDTEQSSDPDNENSYKGPK